LASNYLNKLSGIMRFMLYETQAESIPLSKELDYIEQYIALQKIRFSNPEKVQFSVHGSVDAQRIAPMLFIPFIENAFKFGETKKSEAMISIEFRISAKEIQFECKNAFQPTLESTKDSGLGNVLIAKRIAHLYPAETSAANFGEGRHLPRKIDNFASMKLNCIIVEDEPLALARARAYALKIPYLQVQASFDNGMDALLHSSKRNPVDVLFLDIQLG
jgi:LytS/YehU family sensor histidine kinase